MLLLKAVYEEFKKEVLKRDDEVRISDVLKLFEPLRLTILCRANANFGL